MKKLVKIAFMETYLASVGWTAHPKYKIKKKYLALVIKDIVNEKTD